MLEALGLMMICVLVFCYKLQNTLNNIASIIERNNENLKVLISETVDDLQQVHDMNPCIEGPSN